MTSGHPEVTVFSGGFVLGSPVNEGPPEIFDPKSQAISIKPYSKSSRDLA